MRKKTILSIERSHYHNKQGGKMTKEEMREYKREWARAHKEEARAASRKYYKAHRETILQYHKDNKERFAEARHLRPMSEHRKNQINLYSAIRKVINRYKQGKSFRESTLDALIGLPKDKFMQYLESTLPKGKTILKHYGRDKYEIDHIIPCNKFDLGDPEQLKMCFNWRNMRLLKRKDNLARDRSCDVPINREGHKDNRQVCEPDSKGDNSTTVVKNKTGNKQKDKPTD